MDFKNLNENIIGKKCKIVKIHNTCRGLSDELIKKHFENKTTLKIIDYNKDYHVCNTVMVTDSDLNTFWLSHYDIKLIN